jgi:hypothetical protein
LLAPLRRDRQTVANVSFQQHDWFRPLPTLTSFS